MPGPARSYNYINQVSKYIIMYYGDGFHFTIFCLHKLCHFYFYKYEYLNTNF